MIESHDTYGFIIVDGNGALFGTLSGSTRTILEKFSVDLPRKHGRGGQSSNRFERIRTERRHHYMKEVTEAATDNFLTDDRPNVKGIVIAGSAEIKTDMIKTDLIDQRLIPIIIKVVDIAYGGEVGFNQAIDLSENCLKNVRYVHEKKCY
jgi:peptide chain release factor subunit 1